MALYRISGIWKNSNNVITHYPFHTVCDKTISRLEKTSKDQAISLLEMQGNKATTWIWNCAQAKWDIVENVEVVNGK
jgi:hypothetical protein